MKPDIVFFGEGLGDEFHNAVAQDKNDVDLLIMIGSSLKVRPVALIPSSIDPSVPQVKKPLKKCQTKPLNSLNFSKYYSNFIKKVTNFFALIPSSIDHSVPQVKHTEEKV